MFEACRDPRFHAGRAPAVIALVVLYIPATIVLGQTPPDLAPSIAAVYPNPVYSEDGYYQFTIEGDGFSGITDLNRLVINNRELPVIWSEFESGRPSTTFAKWNTSRTLTFHIPASFVAGAADVQIRVSPHTSVAEHVVFSPVPRWAPGLAASICVGLLGLLVLWMLRKYRHQIDVKMYGPLRSIFIDKETDTYSLSRLQLLLWTAVSAYSFLYLLFVWLLVLRKFVFPNVPAELAGLLLTSAGTTFLASGITSARGPKGAGGVYPNLADFVSTGGIVSAERIQFLVWTLVGFGTFLTLTLVMDQAKLSGLPNLPPEIVYLTGASALGYLGGKAARKPGPIIDDIIASFNPSLRLQIEGRYLSKNASFRIDHQDVPVLPAGSATDPKGPATATLTVLKDVPSSDSQFAIVLLLAIPINEESQKWTADKHTLTLINSDGQQADWPFEVSAAGGQRSVAADPNITGGTPPTRPAGQPITTVDPGVLQTFYRQIADSATVIVSWGPESAGSSRVINPELSAGVLSVDLVPTPPTGLPAGAEGSLLSQLRQLAAQMRANLQIDKVIVRAPRIT